MSYGLRVWNENGALAMDTNTFTYQIMGQWLLDFSGGTAANPISYTLSIPGFNPATCALILLPTRASDIPNASGTNVSNSKGYPYVSVSSGQAVVSAKVPLAEKQAGTSQVIVRAMAIRYG